MRTPGDDPSAADWLRDRLLPWPDPSGVVRVGAIVPTGFEAYARLFHDPAPGVETGPRLLWADVAGATGRTVHPLMEWHRITTPAPGSPQSGWDPSAGHPLEGEPSDQELRELAGVLRRFTASANLVWFCAWAGFGGTSETGSQIRLPGREYLLSSGPIEAATSFAHPPNVWWPDDRSWCVASEIDLLTTYVAGSASCVDRLINAPELEVMPVAVDDRVDADADAVNVG